MGGIDAHVAVVADLVIDPGERVLGPDLEHTEGGRHGAQGAGLQADLAGETQTVLHAHEVVIGGRVVERHPTSDPSRLDRPVASGTHDYAEAGHVRVAAHVVPVLLEPAGHEERLRDDRVKPGLEDDGVVAVVCGLHDVRDLHAALRMQLLFEVERYRRGHVESYSAPGGLTAQTAALEDEARRNRAGAQHHRVGANGQATPVLQAAAHAIGMRAAHQDLRDAALGQDAHRPGKIALCARQRPVERRELLAVGAADVAIARPEAIGDVRLDEREWRAPLEGCDDVQRPRAEHGGGANVLYAEELAYVAECLGQAVGGEPRVEAARVEPALAHARWQIKADRVVDHGAAAHAHALGDLKAEVLGQRERTVCVKVGQLLGLVLGEVTRLDVRPALEQQYLAAPPRHLVGQHGAAGTGADDDHVGREVLTGDLCRAHAGHAGIAGIDLSHRLEVSVPA